MQLALFDLDHTLIDVDSDYLWGEYLVKNNLVDEAVYRQKNTAFYLQYIAGNLDARAYNEFVASFLAQHNLEQLQQWREDYVKTDIVPNIRPQAVHAINQHLASGDEVIIISATNNFIVNEIAKQFNIASSHVIATELELTATGYTGKVAGEPNFQAGKLKNLEKWLANKQINKSYAYSDSFNDLPLLEFADVAICVTPDEKLTNHAKAVGWKIADWKL